MKGRLRDLTNVETIYRVHTLRRRKVRTIRIRRKRAFMGPEDDDASIEVTTPAEAYEVFQAIFAGLDDDQEHFVLLVLSAASRADGFKIIASGGQDGVNVACRYVFHCALLLGAHHILVAHNHPSGALTPSAADIELTRRLAAAGSALEIPLLDHLILGRGTDYLSLYTHDPRMFATPENEPGA